MVALSLGNVAWVKLEDQQVVMGAWSLRERGGGSARRGASVSSGRMDSTMYELFMLCYGLHAATIVESKASEPDMQVEPRSGRSQTTLYRSRPFESCSEGTATRALFIPSRARCGRRAVSEVGKGVRPRQAWPRPRTVPLATNSAAASSQAYPARPPHLVCLSLSDSWTSLRGIAEVGSRRDVVRRRPGRAEGDPRLHQQDRNCNPGDQGAATRRRDRELYLLLRVPVHP